MQKKVATLGHFGFGYDLLNGQTIKTKIVTEELENEYGKENVLKYDTHGGKKALVKLPIQIGAALSKAKNVVIFPAYNGLRIIAPLLYIVNKYFNRSLQYVVIGGWLPTYLDNKVKLKKILQKFDGIYVETISMKNALEQRGFSNIYVMPNCKKIKILEKENLVYTEKEPFKLCTFSRVMRTKGIEDAITSVIAINERYKRTVVTLDIYGQIDSDEVSWFNSLKSEFPPYIKYTGVVEFSESTDVLKSYYALLFPTFHEGEGFAGTLIDAMAAGVPVIASDWKYNSELVILGKTGLLCECNNPTDLEKKIIYALDHNEKWQSMKEECCVMAKLFLPNSAVKVLKENLR